MNHIHDKIFEYLGAYFLLLKQYQSSICSNFDSSFLINFHFKFADGVKTLDSVPSGDCVRDQLTSLQYSENRTKTEIVECIETARSKYTINNLRQHV